MPKQVGKTITMNAVKWAVIQKQADDNFRSLNKQVELLLTSCIEGKGPDQKIQGEIFANENKFE